MITTELATELKAASTNPDEWGRLSLADIFNLAQTVIDLSAKLEEAEAERDRYREGLQAIHDDHARNRWHPDTTYPTELSREWHNGYITLAATHALKAGKYLDPEGSAESEDLWRLGSQGTDAEWWSRTGHCGHCGNVGSSCECNGECGCADLHGPRLPDWMSDHDRVGAARRALLRFMDVAGVQTALGGAE